MGCHEINLAQLAALHDLTAEYVGRLKMALITDHQVLGVDLFPLTSNLKIIESVQNTLGQCGVKKVEILNTAQLVHERVNRLRDQYIQAAESPF